MSTSVESFEVEKDQTKPRGARASNLFRLINVSRKAAKTLQTNSIITVKSVMAVFKIKMARLLGIDVEFAPHKVRMISTQALYALVRAIEQLVFADVRSARDNAYIYGRSRIEVEDVVASRIAAGDKAYDAYKVVNENVRYQLNFRKTLTSRGKKASEKQQE